MSNTDIVRAMFDAYLAQDRDTAEQLLGEVGLSGGAWVPLSSRRCRGE